MTVVACTGQCEACNATGSVGICTAVTGTPRAGHPTCGEFLCAEDGCMTTCQSDAECVSGAVCSLGTCRQGEPAFNGGGVSGCQAAGSGGSAGAGASPVCRAWRSACSSWTSA